VIKAENGIPITLGQVARVEIGQAVRQGGAIKNGEKEAVGGIVLMLKGENSREVTRRVEKKVEEINSSGLLASGLKIVPFYKRTDIVQNSIRTMEESLLLVRSSLF
jgi:Putative silver efflux pump